MSLDQASTSSSRLRSDSSADGQAVHLFELRCRGSILTEPDCITFEAPSIGGALDVARKKARGEWADLYQDGRPICALELVAESGVWLVGAPVTDKGRYPGRPFD